MFAVGKAITDSRIIIRWIYTVGFNLPAPQYDIGNIFGTSI